MDKIKFGTDGWKALIAKDYTLSNVSKVAYATALWLTKRYKNPSAVVGYDCRFGGEMFMEAVAKIFASKGIRVYIPEHFVATPMVSLGIVKLKAHCGIMLSASNSPAEFNGYKLKGSFGGPMLEKDVRDVENLISDDYEIDLELLNWNLLLEQGTIQYIDLESIYIKHIRDSFDIDKIARSGLNFAFDAMYGSGQNVFKKLLPGIKMFHCEVNPTFMGIPPDPQHINLFELSEFIWNNKKIDCAFAISGDGDRLALYDHEGNYIDSHHIMLLLIHYLAHYKHLHGKVVTSFSSTSKIEKLCLQYGIKVERVKLGFKDITKIMISEDVLVGGEESGGITVGSHIPERDGIWMGLMIWQWIVETGKSVRELLEEVYQITGKFAFERSFIDVNKQTKNKIMEKCKSKDLTAFGNYRVNRIEDLDGYKFFFNETAWFMIRPSGSEPIIRTYAEAETIEEAKEILAVGTEVILKIE
ncbi:MAG: hypothetical protein JXJ22_16665 [Bacteroidales bacterium]|nr:hypothetical protein [Bacteroidales bacterium]